MRKYILAALALAVAAPAFAQTGNGAPSGGHYNLNIIGVENPKNSTLTSSNRHTIFVALGKNDQVTSRIYLTPGEDFRVCDGNAFDQAIGCDGSLVASQGAVFQLPCNTNLTAGTDPDGEPSTLFPCEAEDPQLAYEVWLRELGKPGGGMTMQTCATEVGDQDGDGVSGEVVCSTENVVTLRDPGKEVFKNVTQQLTSLNVCFDTDTTDGIDDIDCFRYALFRDEFEDWHWQYDNRGLRLAQIRFYPLGS
jgi:hypothetical protein